MGNPKRNHEPLVAMRAGTYREFSPSPALGAHFNCFWTHEIDGSETRMIGIVPDGYCDLVWINGRLMVAGPDRTSAFPAIRGGEEIVGARFAPGAAAAWLKLPLSEIVGKSVPLRDIWGADAADIDSRLTDCGTMDERMRTLRQELEKYSFHRETAPKDIRFLFERMSDPASGDKHLAKLLDTLEIGERQFRRRCHHYFGYGAKTLARIRRFQSMLQLCRNDAAMSLAELALAAGYADQAHMTRDVGEFSTLTPLEIRRQIAA